MEDAAAARGGSATAGDRDLHGPDRPPSTASPSSRQTQRQHESLTPHETQAPCETPVPGRRAATGGSRHPGPPSPFRGCWLRRPERHRVSPAALELHRASPPPRAAWAVRVDPGDFAARSCGPCRLDRCTSRFHRLTSSPSETNRTAVRTLRCAWRWDTRKAPATTSGASRAMCPGARRDSTTNPSSSHSSSIAASRVIATS